MPTTQTKTQLLKITDLCAKALDGDEILRGLNIEIANGEVHVIMGPNGSGKSTLANVLLGNPAFDITHGDIQYRGESITDWSTEDRGKAGIFLGFQHPEEIPGVPMLQFLRQSLSERTGENMSVLELRLLAMEWMKELGMDPSFMDRYLNEGFSGGEKKRGEILQMAILKPDLAILDETDSGLDVDALGIVASGVNKIRTARPALGTLLITHYQRLLNHITPDFVHVLIDGRIVESGDATLAKRLDEFGFSDWTGQH